MAYIMQKGRTATAAMIQAECHRNGSKSQMLDSVLEILLDPKGDIDDTDKIDWCKALIAGGMTPENFAGIVRRYDNHAKCGLVWIPHVVAYRCRTCGISPCMSICRNCFKKGDHSTHDFNMFLSQAGGACDCGDTSVMKADGFCSDHRIKILPNKPTVPDDLMLVSEAIMPRLLLRLLHHFREMSSKHVTGATVAKDCEKYCSMLMDLNNMGELMRKVMTKALINTDLYKSLVDPPQYARNEYEMFLFSSNEKYENALKSFPSPEPPDEYKHLPALSPTIHHSTLLEEFIFWTFKFEFPQNIVCFLLNMLPDQDYKEHLTRTFVMHYSRIPSVLEISKDPDTLSNRVVHMSVQLFSNEGLALKMVKELSLLHVMIVSLKLMMSKNLIQNTLHDPGKNFHYVIDCAERAMKEHCYWPLVSDFNNVLSHESVALVFLNDDNLVDMWFQFLSMLQGMNVNLRETDNHVDYEPSSYYAAFSCELEASAYPMWSIISHLEDATHAQLAKKITTFCLNYLRDWLDAIYLYQPKLEKKEMMRSSFHFPIHRYLAAFTCQAVRNMGMELKDILPSDDLLPLLMMHPLRVQSFFSEILAGIWVRNGLQIKGQAMTYIQANFCNSMVDMDLFFLQICCTQLPAQMFLTTAIDVFGVTDWIGMCPINAPQEMEQDSMLEGLLTFLATIVTSRTNLGNSEQTQCIIEISALLATGDKTHSQLLEWMPERSGNAHTRNFERFLKDLSEFRRPLPASDSMEQGMFIPVDDVWEKYYDPLHVLLRAVHRRDFQNSMDRFVNYVRTKKRMSKQGTLWPPYRMPGPVGPGYSDPACILHSRVLHATLLSVLYRAVHSHNISEHMLSITIFLLEMAVTAGSDSASSTSTALECGVAPGSLFRTDHQPPELLNCYPGDCLRENLRLIVNRISLAPAQPQVSPANYNTTTYDSDVEWDGSETDPLPMIDAIGSGDGLLDDVMTNSHGIGLELAIPQDLSVVRERSIVLLSDSQENLHHMDDDDDFSLATTSIPPTTHLAITDSSSPGHRIDYSSSLAIRRPASENTHYGLPQLALPAATGLESDDSSTGMEVALRRDLGLSAAIGEPSRNTSEMFSPTAIVNNSGILLPFPRVHAVAVPISSMDIVPSTNVTGSGLSSGNIGGSGGGRRGTTNAHKKRRESANSCDSDNTILINESILSLLLKLHSQLSGKLDSFSLDEDLGQVDQRVDGSMDIDFNEAGPSSRDTSSTSQDNEKLPFTHAPQDIDSRIGDGPFFIGKLLRKIAKYDLNCATTINDLRQSMWPNQREKHAEECAREQREKEERSKRAKERQDRLMAEFATKQRKFMEEASEGMEYCTDDDEEMEQPREMEYDCIICNQTSPSTESKPIGLVVLVESTGVIGHRRKVSERFRLPLSEEEQRQAKHRIRFATAFNSRSANLAKFGHEAWFLSQNSFYDSGVHVQSCGHHVHLTCHDAYLTSLYTPSQRNQTLNVERGEFLCPVCRQLSNSVLPLSPQLDRPTPIIRIPTAPFETLVTELTTLIRENIRPARSTALSEAMGRAMEDMTNITHRKTKRLFPTFRNLFLFVTSIARTNLEAEIIQRGGSLCSSNTIRFKPRRDCIVPLLHVLSIHVRVLTEWPLWRSWATLCGLSSSNIMDPLPVPSHCIDGIPVLLADPIALMLKFILLAPLHLDQVYFTCIVKVLYNLLYYQVVIQLCTTLTDSECDQIVTKYLTGGAPTDVTDPMVPNLGAAMAFVLANTNRCTALRRRSIIVSGGGSSSSNTTTSSASPEPAGETRRNSVTDSSTGSSSPCNNLKVNINSMEQRLQRLCLPFLRVSALLRHHLYHQELPEVVSPQLEFVRLVYFLELVTESMDWDCFNASKALCFFAGTETVLPTLWLQQLLESKPNDTTLFRELIINQHVAWQQPRLLGLPREYERLFTYYHEQTCQNCLNIPKESSICLLCGTIVCLKQGCCLENDWCEAVRHTIQCGGGTGIFLVVTSTYIIVIRGRRACLWGSLYLDDFDEEDRDLKRGKPLYLNEDRFNLLESQWLSHRFAYTKHTWVFHRDSL